MRSYNRSRSESRPVSFEANFTQNADGSVLVCFGETKVVCTAFLEEKVPPFLRNKGTGWVTAEYGMLPGATHTRTAREAARGKQSGRTVEISRLIGRSLRACVDFEVLGERTLTVDCDVIQADGGTRTASITGGCIALILALWRHRDLFKASPVVSRVAALSVGILNGSSIVDLDYKEDSNADVDLNLVMTHDSRFIEIQGAAEKEPFSRVELLEMLKTGGEALDLLLQQQQQIVLNCGVTTSWAI